jgi:hypothetical protein
MMKRVFAVAAASLVLLAAVAQAQSQRRPQAFDRLAPVSTPSAPPLTCKANKMYACGASGCDVEDHPNGLPVEFELKTAEGKGYLCTYTYCRSFTLMGWRGRPKATGLVWSSQSGSTPPADRTPEYDYTLTIAEDWRSFTLAAPGNGMVSGFTGVCERPAR